MKPTLLIVAVMLVLAPPAQAAKELTRLFTSTETLQITISGPINKIVKQRQTSTQPHPATLAVGGAAAETLAINLSARGKSRRDRDRCRFPPLRVRFQEKPGKESLFHKNRSLKLVTHCKSSSSFQQYLLLEYTAYRLFNAITDVSLKVRLAEVSYVDDSSGKEVAKNLAFFIEDADDLAGRSGMVELDIPEIQPAQLADEPLATLMVFQYLIGNVDFAALSGPPGGSCCHNGKVLGLTAESRSDLIVVPYDFDNAGLVDPPNAFPPDGLGIKSVRQRLFRGYCSENQHSIAAMARFVGKRDAIYGVIDTTPGLSAKSVKKTKKYLDAFFKDIGNPKTVEKKLLSKCRS